MRVAVETLIKSDGCVRPHPTSLSPKMFLLLDIKPYVGERNLSQPSPCGLNSNECFLEMAVVAAPVYCKGQKGDSH